LANASLVQLLLQAARDQHQTMNLEVQDHLGNTPLIVACLNGNVEAVATFLGQGANVDCADYDGVTPLIISIKYHHQRIIELLFKYECSASKADKFGNHALHWASLTGNVEAFSFMLSIRLPNDRTNVRQSLSFNESNLRGDTPLSLAIKEGHLQIVQLYFSKKQLHNLLSEAVKKDLLALAREKERMDIAELIEFSLRNEFVASDIGVGREIAPMPSIPNREEITPDLVMSPTSSDQTTDPSSPLQFNYTSDFTTSTPDMNSNIIDSPSSIYSDFWSSSSNSPYSPVSPPNETSDRGDFKSRCERLITSSGPQVLFKLDPSGFGLIHFACSMCDLQAVNYFLNCLVNDPQKRNCMLNLRDVFGNTPLCLVTPLQNNKMYDILNFLLENGADPSLANNLGETPLHLAAKEGNLALQTLLQYQKRLNLNARDNNGNTPFMNACLHNHIDAVHRLLLSGASINQPDLQNTTPVMAATKLGHNRIALFLLENKVGLDQPDLQGNTLLHWAAVTNNVAVVRELLKRGRKVSSKNEVNNRKETPIFLAAKEGHTEIVRMLLEQNVDITIQDQRGRTCLTLETNQEISEMLRAAESKQVVKEEADD